MSKVVCGDVGEKRPGNATIRRCRRILRSGVREAFAACLFESSLCQEAHMWLAVPALGSAEPGSRKATSWSKPFQGSMKESGYDPCGCELPSSHAKERSLSPIPCTGPYNTSLPFVSSAPLHILHRSRRKEHVFAVHGMKPSSR